jgi:hypothetical protein
MSLLGSKIRVITDYSSCGSYRKQRERRRETEHVFLNVYGAQESIPRNEFRQPM